MKLRRLLLIIGGAAAIMVFTTGVGFVLWRVPKEEVASLNAKSVKPEDVLKAENETRATLTQTVATLAQIIGGFAVLIGVYVAWQNITATKEGQVTDRFYKAIEQLGAADNNGKPKLELRLGGIYALERIARDSERDHWPIMEVLTAYVREHAQWKETNLPANQTNSLATDIQAILTVIGRRQWSYKKGDQRLDLRWTDLRKADLIGAHLAGVDLLDAHLEGAHLDRAHLDDAHLEGAYLAGADLFDAALVGADLMDAHLEGAQLAGAALVGAALVGTRLEHAYLAGAHLDRAHLEGAHLEGALLGGTFGAGAHLEGAHLEGAHLEGAYLKGVDLTGAHGMTQAQIDSAIGDATTKLPEGIVMPESWKKKSAS